MKLNLKKIIIVCLLLIPAYGLSQDINENSFVNLMAYSKKPSDLMYQVTSIIPVGWSESGYFAFIKETPVEGRGGVKYLYAVFNTKTDKIVWSKLHDIENPDSKGREFAKSYAVNREIFEKQLEYYNIKKGEGVGFLKFPLRSSDGSVYNTELITTKRAQKEIFIGSIKTLEVNILKNQDKKKTIYSEKQSKAFSYWTAGFFKSPFEERILVVIGEEERGFEGTEGDFIFTGCHLKVGFK